MRDFLLAIAVFAIIATSTAVDEECIERKIRGLPLHWPNPLECSTFYRCTNKNIKRELSCPRGKEYNPKTGRCGNKGLGLCRLSLAAPLAASVDSSCVGEMSGTFMPDPSSCRDFYLCDNNTAYPQYCDPGSYFDTEILACAPDTKTVCWENLCVKKKNGTFVANDKDCHGFYICDNEKPIAQKCDEKSYFNATGLFCQPGDCPSDETTTATTITTTEATTTAKTETTTSKPETTTISTAETTTTSNPETTTKACTGTTTTCAPETTTTTCAPVSTTTTTCTPTTTLARETTTTKKLITRAPKTTTITTTTFESTTTTTCTTTTCPPTTTTTTCTPETTTTCTTTTPTTTTRKPKITTTTCTTTTCPPTTTTRKPKITTSSCTTTTCKPETTTTTCTTTTCPPETTTTTSSTTTCAPYTTTTACKQETSTTTCTTTTCRPEITTTPCAAQQNSLCNSLQCQTVKNGFVFPAQNNSAGFCVCLNKSAEYRECPDEAQFDEILKICVTQDKVCPSSRCNNLPNYSTFRAANTTTGFCRCLSGQASFFKCAATNFEYDNVLGVCVESNQTESNCTESTKLCKGLYKEGEFVPNPDNCMLFYICHDGDLEEVNCDRGNYFDNDVKACLPDTDNKCPACHQAQRYLNNRRHKRSVRASSCPEGAQTPAFDCDKYYKCSKGHQLLYGCGKDNFFNVTTLTCQFDTQHVCWPVNSCTDGDKSPNLEDNTKYYECLSGKQVSKTCCDDTIFNKLTKSCVARQECTCPGGYKEGEISTHPTDCDKFYICSEGEQVLQECGEGNYFNETTLCCEKDVNNICHVKEDCLCPGGYEEGELSPHPTDCDKYYICEGGKQIVQECGKDNYFDKDNLCCEPDLYNECWAKKACTCPGGYQEGEFSAHPTDCNKYYICHDSKQVLEDCGVNNYFNNDTLCCEPDTYHVCWPNLCAGQPNGALVANPQQCNSFFLCENDEATAKACFEGQRFDPSTGACVADLKAVCYNPCANETAGPVVLLPHPICNEYYFCNGHKTFVGTCLVGSFDIETGVCNENKKCFPNPCDNPNVTVFPDPYDVTKFYWCNAQKRPIPYDCPEGTEFDTEFEICKKYSDPGCPVCTKDGSYPTLDDTDDSEFCVCNNGLATKIECSQNYTFNPELGVCYSNAPCDPSFCLDAKEYDTAPNRNDSKSFCMCINKKPIIIDCPNNGTFNPYTLECSDYAISPECLQSTCVGRKDNNYIFNPINTKTSNGFCQCMNQIATFRPCSYGSTFNPDLLICQLPEINCNSYQCRGLAEKTIIPSVTTTEGYCECNNGVAVYHNCPDNGEFNATTSKCEAPLCDMTQCATAKNNYPFAASANNGFCLCSVGFVPCETDGTLYSETFGTCIDPCPQTACVGKPDKYLVSSDLNNYSFCVCHTYYTRTSATYELCPSESFVFQEAQQLCVPNSVELCGTDPCKTVGASQAKDTLTGFCFCPAIGKTPQFERCSGGVFVPGTSTCMPTAEDVCDVSLCAYATIDHPITLPANNSITEFCYCSSPTNAMLLPCPEGKYYNQAKAMCISQQGENCRCPNNVAEGDKVADSTSCNKYSVCKKGVMQSETCPSGDYFSVEVNCCVPDTTGICAKQSACTCLGIYYENELLPHPVNPQMYYACQGNTLHEYKCQEGRVYSVTQKQCIVSANTRLKRSADISNDHEVRTFKKLKMFFKNFY